MSVPYRPIQMQPNGNTLDMSVNQNFTAVMQTTSKITDYQLVIYNNLTGATLYDSTKINLASVLYNNETLVHTVPAGSVSSNRDLKWTLQVWDGADSAISGEIPFSNYGTPTITLSVTSPVTTRSYEFQPIYSHPQGIDIESYIANLYNNNGILLQSSGLKFTGNTKYTFSGFQSGESYKIEYIVTDTNGIEATTGLIDFSVSYTSPSILVTPTLENDYCGGYLNLKWSGAFDTVGIGTGSISYENDYVVAGNKALRIGDDTSSVKFSDLKIAETFTDTRWWTPLSADFTGDILEYKNNTTSKTYRVGYDGDKFYANIDGVYIFTSPFTLSVNSVYIMIIFNDHIVIKEEVI